MRELLNQDRALPLGMAKFAINLIAIGFLIAAIAIVLLGIASLTGGHLLPGLIQIFGGPALLLSIFLLLRLLLEILMASHRQNDRLSVMADTMRETRQSPDEQS